ncbi:hypothetical protein [Mucilaginibacter sp.]|uniref:hypothetical protein n=1 Tax=Mucilaginibacter sp. TaxID=1882438 RepID=UPI002ED1C05A
MLRYEASSSPCIAAMLVEEDPSCLRMTVFFNYVIGSDSETTSSPCIAYSLAQVLCG